jgi:hypothetical protein
VVNPFIEEVTAMKKLSVLFLIAILGIVVWALPAGAEKIRMTDAELDGIAAGIPGVSLTVPPLSSPIWNCCARVSLIAAGGLMPLNGTVQLAVSAIPINPTLDVSVALNATGTLPGIFNAGGFVSGPKGLVVPIGPFVISIP